MTEVYKLVDIMKYSQEYLEKKGVDQARLIAEKIIARILGMNRLALYINYDRPIINEEREEIKSALKKRGVEKIPIQYIFGEEYFYGYKFNVNKNVLIPRPDTEILVSKVLELIKDVKEPKVIDIGTGSGAIAITIGNERKDAVILGVDISDGALETAEINKKENETKNVKFIKSNVFENVKYKEFDAVVSNPPYIEKEEYETLAEEVRRHEPEIALVASEKGLYFYEKIALEAKRFLKSGGIIAFETGWQQARSVAAILEKNSYTDIEIIKDLNGIERVVTGKKNV